MPIQVDINAILDDSKTYKPETVKALREFKKEKSFRETNEVRLAKMQELINKFTTIYGMEPITVTLQSRHEGQELRALLTAMDVPPFEGAVVSGLSHADLESHTIFMSGKLSVITLLHEFAHMRSGPDELRAQRWAVNLFRKVFKKQFARLHFNGWAFFTPQAAPPSEAAVMLAAAEQALGATVVFRNDPTEPPREE